VSGRGFVRFGGHQVGGLTNGRQGKEKGGYIKLGFRQPIIEADKEQDDSADKNEIVDDFHLDAPI
jgi:hypothetical protein